MYKIFILLLCLSHLYAYELAKNYMYKNTIIYSNDLFPELPQKFELLKIPSDKEQYRVDAKVIAKTFELKGIEIDISKARYVNFTKYSSIDFTHLKTQLADMLRERYPSIQIDDITITPRGYLASLEQKSRGVFDDHFDQHASGTLYILDNNGLRHYLDYTVRATISALYTTQKISRRERLSGFNTLLKPIPFTSFNDKPLTSLPEQPSRFRSNLKEGELLTLRNIETIPLVLKNEKVIVQVKNETVIVEFSATATQEGVLYDIITIQKSDGKRAKAKVIGEHRVELQ
jgi:flagellar basal body P-ring formation protein FlgA